MVMQPIVRLRDPANRVWSFGKLADSPPRHLTLETLANKRPSIEWIRNANERPNLLDPRRG